MNGVWKADEEVFAGCAGAAKVGLLEEELVGGV
jgi:hypothetical protein